MIGRRLHRAAPPKLPPGSSVPLGPWPWSETTLDVLPAATEEEACDLPVVSAFLGLVTNLLAQMPLQAITGTDVTTTPPILRNPIPGPNRTLFDWLTEYVRDVTLYGNYMAVIGDPSWTGWPDQLYGVPWGAWTVDPDGNYRVGSDTYGPGEVFHVAVRRRTGDRIGRGLLQTHRRTLAAAIAAERWSESYYLGGAAPPLILSHPNSELTMEQASDLKAKLRAATRRREPVVVPVGTQLNTLSSDADSAQLAESRRWNALQLCQSLGLPAALLGMDSPSLTYRNITDVFQQFVTTTVMGFIAPLEAQLTSQCLPRGTSAKFDTAAVLRPDYAGRVDLATKGLAGGVYTAEEARALVDLAPTDTPVGPPQLSVVPPQEASQ